MDEVLKEAFSRAIEKLDQDIERIEMSNCLNKWHPSVPLEQRVDPYVEELKELRRKFLRKMQD